MKTNKKKRKIWLYLLIIFLVIIGGTGAFAFSVYRNIARTVDNMHMEIETENVRDNNISLNRQDPFSILLLGIDDEELDSGRSDSIIVVTVNPNQNSTKMLSIPRDTRTEIIGRGTMDKINHAYVFGGAGMSINTVQNFLDIPIDYYIEVNMQGTQQLVDVLGGITVNNTLDFTFGGTHFAKGTINLNGQEALNYSRMRKNDPRGDFGRQARQRQVIEAIVRQAANFSSLTKYGEILEAIQDNMRTNVTLNEIVSISRNYQTALDDVQQLQLIGTSQRINGIYYQVMSAEEVNKVSTALQQHLELE